MKISLINGPKTVMSNPTSKHNYFAWPTVARLKNGRLAVVASGFRIQHVCPFGKTVLSFSEDEGESYTLPAPVIDTPLDDRDGGILPFGKSGVIVTSFNNKLDFQRRVAEHSGYKDYRLAYLDAVDREEEARYLGASFRVSFDNGVTFGALYKSPVTSPHGPVQRQNGDIVWVGRTFSPKDAMMAEDCICAYLLHPENGEMEYIGRIDDVVIEGEKQLSCEPYAFEREDGVLLCHIRVQSPRGCKERFTTYQAISEDGGRTWSKPEPLLSVFGGAPSHIMRHSSGVLVAVYGFRGAPYGAKPFGIKAMFSRDNGKTWDTEYDIYKNEGTEDIGYPSTVELSDGSLLTVFYAKEQEGCPAVIMQQKWRIEE
ncbi:MAG: exo-alpha-sialidase [Clostridia bacterium]|nr:exo-alpha-sialidase [Clostridia bacterium]MBQ9129164.1 exo-alpha-sialidase [Clostridia bacterium]